MLRGCVYILRDSNSTHIADRILRFLLAQLHVESLKTKTSAKQVRKALNHLPVELDKTYEDAMERIQKQPEDESKLAMRLLSWITHAIRPLTIGEIQHAMAVMDLDTDENSIDLDDLHDEALLITICGGIAVIDHESRVIRLVHYTTQEYFEKQRKGIFPDAQVNISRSCIMYLSMEAFMEGPCSMDEEMEIRLETYKLLEYASRHWGDHSRGETEEAIEEEVLSFLDDKVLPSSIVQGMTLPKYRHDTWSQDFPKELPRLAVAARFGLKTITGKMIRSGDHIERTGNDQRTALHLAAWQDHMAVVQLLLEHKANIEAQDKYQRTALHWAAW
jgi:hypothetical protein